MILFAAPLGLWFLFAVIFQPEAWSTDYIRLLIAALGLGVFLNALIPVKK